MLLVPVDIWRERFRVDGCALEKAKDLRRMHKRLLRKFPQLRNEILDRKLLGKHITSHSSYRSISPPQKALTTKGTKVHEGEPIQSIVHGSRLPSFSRFVFWFSLVYLRALRG